jgi:hypothetical protein
MNNMETYQKFKKELSVYENASNLKINLVIFIHKFFRFFTTRYFDFIVSLAIFIFVPLIFVNFSLTILCVSTISHFCYWVIFYLTFAKYFESDMYEQFTIRIDILKEIKSRK